MGYAATAAAYYAQDGFDARFEWGIEGVRRLAPLSAVVVIVDVLRFTTAVEVAVARGAAVYPYLAQSDGSAETYARDIGARLAEWRAAKAGEHSYSLSPASLLQISPGERLVLPSPNGATLSFLAAEAAATVFAGCLRNATAVGKSTRRHDGVVTVIAAGERWGRDAGSLRPAVEDLLGAGAILTALAPSDPSPEACAAMAAFQAAQPHLRAQLLACCSGRELVEKGFAQDVNMAAEYDVSDTVPVMSDGAFRAVE